MKSVLALIIIFIFSPSLTIASPLKNKSLNKSQKKTKTSPTSKVFGESATPPSSPPRNQAPNIPPPPAKKQAPQGALGEVSISNSGWESATKSSADDSGALATQNEPNAFSYTANTFIAVLPLGGNHLWRKRWIKGSLYGSIQLIAGYFCYSKLQELETGRNKTLAEIAASNITEGEKATWRKQLSDWESQVKIRAGLLGGVGVLAWGLSIFDSLYTEKDLNKNIVIFEPSQKTKLALNPLNLSLDLHISL